MLLNLLSLGALVFLAFIFFTLFLRSVHSHHIAARIVGGLLGALLTLVFVAALGAALFGLWRTSVPRVRPLPAIKVTSTPELITRGRALAQSCVPCHSFDGSPDLNGGTRNMAVGYVVYGDVYPRNLTPGGELKGWTDGEIVRAVRDGINKDGLPLIGHPNRDYAGMSDADAAALVAYLRSQPELRHDQPRRNLNLLGLWAAAGGLLQTSEPAPFTILPAAAPAAPATVGGGG